MKKSLEAEALLNGMTEEFPDCLDFCREFNRYKFNLEQLLPLVGPDSKVLDIGAGHGVMSVGLRATGAEVTAADSWLPYAHDGSDRNPAMHRTGNRENILQRFRDHGIQALETDLLGDRLPLDDESFDVAIILAVIEHFPGSPKKVLEEAKRVLKPGGILVIEVPNVAALRNRLKLLLGKSIHFAIEDWYESDPFHGHFRELTKAELQKHVEFLGMEPMWLRTSDSSFHNTKYPDGSYERKYRFNSAFQIAKAFYLVMCMPFPTFQFQLVIAARKV